MHTLLLIKPNATRENNIGVILKIIEENDFTIEALKLFRMNSEISNKFYAEHIGKKFFPNLIEFMHSGKIVGAVLQKENAVEELRKLVGNTDSKKAEPGTIRNLFGIDVQENAVHASDSPQSAEREIGLIFPEFNL